MPTPKPDTSAKNVARVLRSSSGRLMLWITNDRCRDILEERAIRVQVDAMEALADALEREAESATPWSDRLENACIEYYPTFGTREQMRPQMDAALRAAFPEYAPND